MEVAPPVAAASLAVAVAVIAGGIVTVVRFVLEYRVKQPRIELTCDKEMVSPETAVSPPELILKACWSIMNRGSADAHDAEVRWDLEGVSYPVTYTLPPEPDREQLLTIPAGKHRSVQVKMELSVPKESVRGQSVARSSPALRIEVRYKRRKLPGGRDVVKSIADVCEFNTEAWVDALARWEPPWKSGEDPVF